MSGKEEIIIYIEDDKKPEFDICMQNGWKALTTNWQTAVALTRVKAVIRQFNRRIFLH